MTVLGDPRVEAVLARLRVQARRQLPGLIRHYLPKLPRLLAGRGIDWARDAGFYADKLIPIDAAQGELLYLLARIANARQVVEFGTSFGVSTLYLAAAVRDNGGGRVIGTEIEPGKAHAATANLAAAGLADQVELRRGDARDTLRDLDGAVDLLLLDGWPDAAADVLDLVEPRLHVGSVVVIDNVTQFAAQLRPVVARMTAMGGYRAVRLPMKGGTIAAVRE